ncbi:MAG: ABC transporter permease [Alphaproteobacteria bacterium]
MAYAKRFLTSPLLAGLLGIAGLAIALEFLVANGLINGLVVARPSHALASIPELNREQDLFANAALTLGMTASAILLSIVVGVPFGYFLYRYAKFGEAYEAWLAAAFSAPHVLLYPLFLVVFGRTYFTVVIMAFTSGVIPIILQTRQGLANINPTLINVGRNFNLPPRMMFRKIMLPAAVPSIFNGIRLGVMYTLVVVVALEYLIDFGGLGRIVSQMYLLFEIPKTYASILFVILVSIFFYALFGRIERWLRPA